MAGAGGGSRAGANERENLPSLCGFHTHLWAPPFCCPGSSPRPQNACAAATSTPGASAWLCLCCRARPLLRPRRARQRREDASSTRCRSHQPRTGRPGWPAGRSALALGVQCWQCQNASQQPKPPECTPECSLERPLSPGRLAEHRERVRARLQWRARGGPPPCCALIFAHLLQMPLPHRQPVGVSQHERQAQQRQWCPQRCLVAHRLASPWTRSRSGRSGT